MKQAIKWLSAATCAVFLLCGAVHARQIPGDESNASDGTPEVSVDAGQVLELPRAPEGRWANFFVEHEPNQELLRKLNADARQHADQAQVEYSENRFQKAYDEALAALRVEPDLPPSLLLLGTTAFRLRRHNDARVAFERFIEVAPSELWRTQGLCHALYSLGDYAAARDHYMLVNGVLAGSYEAHRGLGLSLYRLGEYKAAKAALEKAIELRPNSYEPHAWLSEVLFNSDEYEGAMIAAKRAMELDAFDPRAYFTAFRVAAELGQDELATQMETSWRELTDYQAEITAFDNRLLFEPDNVLLHFARMTAHARMLDVKALERAAGELLSLPATGSEVLERGLRVIELLISGGADQQARKLADKLLELFPNDVRLQALILRQPARAAAGE